MYYYRKKYFQIRRFIILIFSIKWVELVSSLKTEAKRRVRRQKSKTFIILKKGLPEAEFYFLASVGSVSPPSSPHRASISSPLLSLYFNNFLRIIIIYLYNNE